MNKLVCDRCGREVVAVLVERTERRVRLIHDPLLGWVAGSEVLRWGEPVFESERRECGCGEYSPDINRPFSD